MMRRYEEAIPTLKKAVTLNPDYMFPHLLLAISYSELDRFTEAENKFSRFAIEAGDERREVMNSIQHFSIHVELKLAIGGVAYANRL